MVGNSTIAEKCKEITYTLIELMIYYKEKMQFKIIQEKKNKGQSLRDTKNSDAPCPLLKPWLTLINLFFLATIYHTVYMEYWQPKIFSQDSGAEG